MKIETKAIVPMLGDFAAALINGDYSGLNDEGENALAEWCGQFPDCHFAASEDQAPEYTQCEITGTDGNCCYIQVYTRTPEEVTITADKALSAHVMGKRFFISYTGRLTQNKRQALADVLLNSEVIQREVPERDRTPEKALAALGNRFYTVKNLQIKYEKDSKRAVYKTDSSGGSLARKDLIYLQGE